MRPEAALDGVPVPAYLGRAAGRDLEEVLVPVAAVAIVVVVVVAGGARPAAAALVLRGELATDVAAAEGGGEVPVIGDPYGDAEALLRRRL